MEKLCEKVGLTRVLIHRKVAKALLAWSIVIVAHMPESATYLANFSKNNLGNEVCLFDSLIFVIILACLFIWLFPNNFDEEIFHHFVNIIDYSVKFDHYFVSII